jgi:Icc-related predicted phosphoesterase
MDICLISDLHGYRPQLGKGDLLIIAGDLNAWDKPSEYIEFNEWLSQQNFKKIIVIGGNHDVYLEKNFSKGSQPFESAEYLYDSVTEFEGLKIFGSPFTTKFPGQNKQCMAFSVHSDFQLKDHFDLIPEGTDILITHSPPHGILDQCANGRVGSEMLRQAILKVKPRLCCFGHIHEEGGKSIKINDTTFINASVVNEFYQNVHKPTHFEL